MVLLNVPLFNEILLDSCSVKISQNPLHFDCTFEMQSRCNQWKPPQKQLHLACIFKSAMKAQWKCSRCWINFREISAKHLQNWDRIWMKAHWKWKFCTATMVSFWKKHQNLQKTWCTFDALLKVHQNDALLHFHRILIHFFKSASIVHQKCITFFMILMNFPENFPIIGIAQGDKP